MPRNNNSIVDFIKKNFSMAKNSVWRGQDFAKLLKGAASHSTYVEIIKSEDLPDPDTLHIRIHDTGLNQLHSTFIELTEKNVKKLKNKKVILIIDETHEPFYGKSNSIYIHTYKPKKGCNGSFKFLTAFILAGDEKYFVDSIPLSLFSNETKEVERILDRVKEMKLRIEVVLMDRWFANSLVIRLLKRYKLKYLMLCKKDQRIQRILLNVKDCTRMSYYINNIKTTLIVKKTEDCDWTFFTNLDFYHLVKYIKVYKKRWNIETGFRVQDEARIKTKSLDIRVRYFLFLIAVLLYNVWKKLREVGVQMQFKRFLIKISDVVEEYWIT